MKKATKRFIILNLYFSTIIVAIVSAIVLQIAITAHSGVVAFLLEGLRIVLFLIFVAGYSNAIVAVATIPESQ